MTWMTKLLSKFVPNSGARNEHEQAKSEMEATRSEVMSTLQEAQTRGIPVILSEAALERIANRGKLC